MTNVVEQDIQTKSLDRRKKNRHLTLIETTYRKNTESDYTEKIAALGEKFKYNNDRDRYWSEPQFSLLYGTPIFAGASVAQKMALNHLYWTIFYSGSASSESNAILYNQITAGVFKAAGDYETLCKELDLETNQEKEHIRAFQKACRETNMALLGKKGLTQFINQKSANIGDRSNATKKRKKSFDFNGDSSRNVDYQERAIRFFVKTMLRKQERFYSHYFRELEQQGRAIFIPTSGWNKRVMSDRLTYFMTLNYGSSPFLACCVYFSRLMANMLRNIQEHRHSLYFKQLEKQGEDIPVATAISRYHSLDESFHTTISQTLARDFYKEFPQPTAYEKLIANIMAYQLQRTVNLTNGISTGLHGNYFGDDLGLNSD
ncbi:MAG: hypothetical protein GDA56_05350 [Hormoscilla sp. GM7CHS1pb]|nr:hypothetical protein [Hormoscilla sp. GM7CHS1pb]